MTTVRIGEALELAYGKNLPTARRAGGAVPVYGSNGIVGWHNTALIDEPTIIIGRKGAAGAVHLTTGPSFPIDTTFYVRIKPHFQFDLRYLAYALRVLDLSRLKIVVAVPGINREHVYREALPYPSMDEQRRIVDLLSRAENIVQMRKEAEAKAKEIIPALFLDMFGDPTRNERGWETDRLGALGQLDRGRSRHRPRDAAHLYGGPYPFVQTGDVAQSGGVVSAHVQSYSDEGLAQSKLWPVGTLCITIAANIAETGVLQFDACFPDSIVGFVPGPKVQTEYVQQWLGFLQPALAAQAPQAAQKNINLAILRALKVPVPPIGLQAAFGQRVRNLRALQSAQRSADEQAERAFQSLLSGVFGDAAKLGLR